MNDESSSIGGIGPKEVSRSEYPATAPGQLPADRLAFVGTLHQQFLRDLSEALAEYLDAAVEPVPAALDQVPAGGFLESTAADAGLITLEMQPVRGTAWIALSPGLVFRVLDILLAAPLASAPAGRSTITEIESHVLHEFFRLLVSKLDAAWTSGGVNFREVSIDSPRNLAQPSDPDAAILVLHGSLRIGEASESPETFRVAIPALAVRLAALLREQAAGESAGESPTRAVLLDALGAATLQLEAVLEGSTVRMSDLAALQPGQVLMLGQPAGSPLACRINGKAKFRGEWMMQGDHAALQILSPLETGGPADGL